MRVQTKPPLVLIWNSTMNAVHILLSNSFKLKLSFWTS